MSAYEDPKRTPAKIKATSIGCFSLTKITLKIVATTSIAVSSRKKFSIMIEKVL